MNDIERRVVLEIAVALLFVCVACGLVGYYVASGVGAI
jgi:hypothetical protein